MWDQWQQFRRRRVARFAMPMLAMAGLLLLAIYFYGRPIDAFTWIALAIVFACSLLPGLFSLRRRWAALILLLGVYIAFPGPFMLIPGLERWYLRDDHGGRRGLEISPGLRFGRNGPNTEVLESYLGPLPGNWWQQAPNFPYIRDGNERVHSRNPIFRDDLPRILAQLPDDGARKQVLTCLVDPENRLRVHQGLLLACVTELGYPPSLDAESWWQAHRDVFRCEHDAMVAAKMTRGWLRRVQRLTYEDWGTVSSQVRAVENQERGAWGGHEDFGEAVHELEWKHRPYPPKEVLNVVWWPSAPEAMFAAGKISDMCLIRRATGTSEPSRSPLKLYTEPEFVFHRMPIEPNPNAWPGFGELEFKLDGRATTVPILAISEDELAVQVHQQVFRGLNKQKLLEIFRE